MSEVEKQSSQYVLLEQQAVQVTPHPRQTMFKKIAIFSAILAAFMLSYYVGTTVGYNIGSSTATVATVSSKPLSSKVITNDGTCGASGSCPGSNCCSKYGFCGSSDAFCGAGCQSAFGTCSTPSPNVPAWSSCNSASICPSSFTCCVAPADSLTGKTTCRLSGQSGLSYGCQVNNLVSPWANCNVATDTCQLGYQCCVAPADVSTGKTTCRQGGIPGQSAGCASPVPTIPAWSTCNALTTTCTSGYTCCVAPADVTSGKTTCRLPGSFGQSYGCANTTSTVTTATPTSATATSSSTSIATSTVTTTSSSVSTGIPTSTSTTTSASPVVTTVSLNGACGGNFRCPSGFCCSPYGYCGSGSSYCGAGCQPIFGVCS